MPGAKTATNIYLILKFITINKTVIPRICLFYKILDFRTGFV